MNERRSTPSSRNSRRRPTRRRTHPSFEDVDPRQRLSIEEALLRYCELDTLAMVMVYEAWRDWVC
jgi:hypothetical protein